MIPLLPILPMIPKLRPHPPATLALLAALALGANACGKKDSADDLKIPETPAASAAQVEQVFESAPAEIKGIAASASEAVRVGDYEKAVVALRGLSEQPASSLSMQQGLALHGYQRNLEAQLINAAAAGDEKAKAAYELLKKMKRK